MLTHNTAYRPAKSGAPLKNKSLLINISVQHLEVSLNSLFPISCYQSGWLRQKKKLPYDRHLAFQVRTVVIYAFRYSAASTPWCLTRTAYYSLFSFLTRTVFAWWNKWVTSWIILGTRIALETAVSNAFGVSDHAKRARNKLRKLWQKDFVFRYLSIFRNLILTIFGMSDDQKIAPSVDDSRQHIRAEVLKAQLKNFGESSGVALNIDSSVINRAEKWSSLGRKGDNNGTTSMEFGNVERRLRTKALRK